MMKNPKLSTHDFYSQTLNLLVGIELNLQPTTSEDLFFLLSFRKILIFYQKQLQYGYNLIKLELCIACISRISQGFALLCILL